MLSAEKARELTEQNKKAAEDGKLEEIMGLIREAVRKGEFYVNCKPFGTSTVDSLKALHYSVECNQRDNEYRVSW